MRLTVSLGVEPHLGLITRYLLLFDTYGLDFGAPSLMRGRVCRPRQRRLSRVESLGTRDRILLSQI
jgi:hypothetical protein